MALTVSALAQTAGLSADTVRYHERVGLLPAPARSAAGYRLYDRDAVGRLRLIKGAQRAGLRLREIVELLQVADRGQCPCGHTETLLRGRLAEVRAELERLRALEADLTRLLEQPPDPPCPEATTAAVAWWCAEDVADQRPPSGKEVTAMPLPDCPCDDCPPGCCQNG
jgi:DNA-binding transcriptional MerR regulator